jgi:hypothetical protein
LVHQCNGREPPRRHCGTGIGPDRDITGSWRDVDEPCASLPAVPPGRARARRGNCRLFDTGRRNPARDGLFAGGRRIRTIGPSCKKRVVLVETRRLLKGADDRDPSKLQPFSRGTGSSNPSPSSGESANYRFPEHEELLAQQLHCHPGGIATAGPTGSRPAFGRGDNAR